MAMHKQINLSEGEWKLMNRLWEHAPRTITQLVADLKDDTSWTKHTVITMLSRMEAKGAVYHKAGARAKQYYPALAHEDIALQETKQFLSRVYGGSLGLMLNAMVAGKALTREELDGLYAILKAAEEGGGDG